MSRIIDAILRLRDEFTEPLSKSVSMMTSASKAGDKTRKSIEKFGNSMASVGGKLTTAVTFPIAAAGAAAVTTAANFESSMSQVQATLGITTDAMSELDGQTVNTMDALSDLAKELGASTKFSATEAAEAINNMAMAGYDVQEVYDTLPTVLDLAAAGSLDLDYATQLVANGMAVMGDKCESAQQMADMMAVTASNAYGSVADFGEGLLVAGGQAAVCSQSLEDTYTALGILGDAGLQGSEGGTALRNTLKNLYQPTDAAAKVLAELGIKTSDAEGNLLGVQGVLQQLNSAMADMSEAEKSTAMSDIFDTRTIAAASALLGSAGDRWDELREAISGASDMYDGQGAAAGMAATQLDNLEGRITILKSSVEGLAISFGEILLPYVQQGVEYIQGLVDKFNSLDSEQRQNIVKFALMAAAVGPLITTFGKTIVTTAKLLGVIAKVNGALAGISKAGSVLKFALGALASPISMVLIALAGVAAIVAVVVTHIDTFRAAIETVGAAVQPYIGGLTAAFSEFGTVVVPLISGAVSLVSDLLANVLAGAIASTATSVELIIKGLTLAITGITDVISGVVDFVTAIANGDWSAAWNALGSVVTGIFETIAGAISTVTGLIGGVVTAVGGAASAAKSFIFSGGSSSTEIGHNAAGTSNWKGGWTSINEEGGEIVNLPSGTQIIPHDVSRNMVSGGNISIAKLADQIIVREDTDIDRIGDAIVRKIKLASQNRGSWSYSGNMA